MRTLAKIWKKGLREWQGGEGGQRGRGKKKERWERGRGIGSERQRLWK